MAAAGAVLFPGVLFSGPRDVPALALTIDDGPDPETTPAILAALEGTGAKATFMLIGEHAEAAPDWSGPSWRPATRSAITWTGTR